MPTVADPADAELALGTSIHVNAYRIASLVPGALALVLAHSPAFLATRPMSVLVKPMSR